MRTFHSCSNCNNTTTGDSIHKCKSCGKIFCSACLPDVRCDRCGKDWGLFVTGFQQIGQIRR